ncbi:hypothetical protein IPL68_03760 [Candidatus Saccharibacteria bacterium]|nr:MAG: hypothetical protein IPL68_03760 [Candidatus Saccharibacteria bacterium]
MSTTLLTVKTDELTKRELKEFAAELGVSTTAFVNLVVKQALRDRRVVLSTTFEPTPICKLSCTAQSPTTHLAATLPTRIAKMTPSPTLIRS